MVLHLIRKEKKYFWSLFSFLLICLVVLIVISITLGSVKILFNDIINNNLSTTQKLILYRIRLPRILMVVLSGACLSVIGIFMQTITKNQLAEPYILGIASGASTGAVSAIVLGAFSFMKSYNVYGGAFIGSCIATGIVIFLVGNSDNPVKLILVGVGVSSFFSACTTMIVYTSSNEAQVRSAMFWMVGSFSGVHWNDILPLLVTTIFIFIIGITFSKDLNILLLGKSEAQFLGLQVKKFYLLITISSSIAIAVLVSKTGIIGFIGLIVPHIGRKFSSVKHEYLIPFSGVIGAILLVISDNIARTLFKPEELPIGIMTAIIGAPLYIHIILKTYKRDVI